MQAREVTPTSSGSHKREDMLIRVLLIGSSSWITLGEMVGHSSSPRPSSDPCSLGMIHAQMKDRLRRGLLFCSCVLNGGAKKGGQCAQQGDWQPKEGGKSWAILHCDGSLPKALFVSDRNVSKCLGKLSRNSLYEKRAPHYLSE